MEILAKYLLYPILIRRRPKNIPIDNNKIVRVHNNTVDALKHAYFSGLATMIFGEFMATKVGNINESIRLRGPRDERNMDLWNNAVGRKYGKLVRNIDELLDKLLEAMENGELITNPLDTRKYLNDDSILEIILPGKVVVVNESETGENQIFYDPRNGLLLTKDEFIMTIKEGKYPMYEIRIINSKETPVSKKDNQTFNNLN